MKLFQQLFRRSATGMFASESLTGHLLRGALGIWLLVWAVQHQTQGALPWVAAFGALLAFRGCPMCWTIGLVESVLLKIRPPKESS